MHNFFIQSYSTYKGLFYWHNLYGYISSLVLDPIIYVVMYTVLGRFVLDQEAGRYYAFGVLVFSMTRTLLGGIIQTYSNDRNLGTISFMFASPANRLVNFISRPVFHFPNSIAIFIIGLISFWLIANLDFSSVNWIGFILSVLVTSASIVGFAQFLGIFTIITKDWTNTMAIAQGSLFALTGMIIPISIFPPAIQDICKLLPITNGLSVIRLTFVGAPLNEIYLVILREALTGLVYFISGFIGFLVFERVAKHTGSLEIETQ